MTVVGVREALRRTTGWLEEAGIPAAAQDARTLLAAAMGLDRSRLSLHLDDDLDLATYDAFTDMIHNRIARRPVSKILGWRQFWGRRFEVTDAVLDPRPETEVLVAAALGAEFSELLDLGTGSGCIAVSLLAERPGATGVASDISAAALAVAGRNAAAHGVADRLWLTQSDWYAGIGGRFDLIVSNPPYIAARELQDLAPEVSDHDPYLALTDGGDGLSAFRAIAGGAKAHLAARGRLLVEIGPRQGGAVARIFAAAGLDVDGIRADMDGRDRVVCARIRP